MKSLILLFADQAAADAVLAALQFAARLDAGTVQRPTGELDGDGQPVMTPVAGRHVVVVVDGEPPEALLPYRVTPDYPVPSFAGVEPWTPPVPPAPENPAAVRKRLRSAATDQRWACENGGITLPGGLKVLTAKADQDRITSVIVNAEIAGITHVDFKAASGWATLSVAQVRVIAAAVATHVQACFSAERAHHEAIAACPDAQLATYDVTKGWPQ